MFFFQRLYCLRFQSKVGDYSKDLCKEFIVHVANKDKICPASFSDYCENDLLCNIAKRVGDKKKLESNRTLISDIYYTIVELLRKEKTLKEVNVYGDIMMIRAQELIDDYFNPKHPCYEEVKSKIEKTFNVKSSTTYMIYMTKLKEWEYYTGYQFDGYTNEEIDGIVKTCPNIVSAIDVSKNWREEVLEFVDRSLPIKTYHLARIAKFRQELKMNKLENIPPATLYIHPNEELDEDLDIVDYKNKKIHKKQKTSEHVICPSLITDGHHMIRALQCAGIDYFPALVKDLGHIVDINEGTMIVDFLAKYSITNIKS
jgi:hypothetical protein